ncbi:MULTISPECIES: ABC transporter permease [unclassified Agarivorans]|uniref:ABC transporter permease n=1 Tax=unclassified Agarivorans TaxID=2636026 RepID=UPI0026E2AEF8|nr:MULTISPECIES: ABC transporter permease [unclassified Agarivorans]MDO6685552.1 ABC transporter permease [Agarivorans sp. 3_MG-2023]MDO6715938.1 ABC transporter permease [Agarivorans sp. 2_MG-2023]
MPHTDDSSLSLRQLVAQQWALLRDNRWLMAMLTWLPLLAFVGVWWVFSSGLTRDLDIAVVDHDHSQLSRSLIRHYDASPTLKVVSVSGEPEARSLLRTGEVSALVIIPRDLEKHTKLAHAPTVAAYYNSQFMVLGKQINSALRQSHGTFSAKVEVARALSHGNTQILQALGSALPIRNQISALYNGNSNYAQFIVSAALPAFWQILIMAVMILVLGAELRDHSYKAWLAKQAWQKITVKLLFFGSLLWLQGVLLCTLMFHGFDWPMRGSWSVLLLALLLCVIASQAIALIFMLLFQDVARALSFAGALTAPSFAFMGVTFPVSDMPWFAQFWRQLIPITHYIETQVSQANYGASALQSLPSLQALLLFSVLFISAAWLIRIRFTQPGAQELRS